MRKVSGYGKAPHELTYRSAVLSRDPPWGTSPAVPELRLERLTPRKKLRRKDSSRSEGTSRYPYVDCWRPYRTGAFRCQATPDPRGVGTLRPEAWDEIVGGWRADRRGS